MKKFIAVALALCALLMVAGASHAQEASGNGVAATADSFSADAFRYGYVYDRSTYDDEDASVRFAVLQAPVAVPVTQIDRFVAYHRAAGPNVIVICRLHERPSDGSYETLRSQGRPIGCDVYR